MDDLYHDLLLDLYRHPLHKERPVDCDLAQSEHNPLCGETIEVFIKLDNNNNISAIGWQGDGCAISQAGASLTADYARGKKISTIQEIAPANILGMLGLPELNPTRQRCALLALTAIKNALAAKQ